MLLWYSSYYTGWHSQIASSNLGQVENLRTKTYKNPPTLNGFDSFCKLIFLVCVLITGPKLILMSLFWCLFYCFSWKRQSWAASL